jgi:hypothetical protein
MSDDDSRKNTAPNSPVVQARGIRPFVQLQIFVRSGGRCEFSGCNKDIMEHPTTLAAGNFAQMAHVVAFKPDGPRGQEGERPIDINNISNLMLLCLDCHHLVDTQPQDYPRAKLEGFKREHEQRIARLTALGPDRKTAVVLVQVPIGGQPVVISENHIADAIFPRYRTGRAITNMADLFGSPESAGFYDVSRQAIDRHMERMFADGGEAADATHVSVFGLAPIPLLVHLGSRLTNKVAVDLYQRHRDTEDWAWKADGEPVRYAVRLRQEGKPGGPVGLMVALSGAIPTESLPEPLRSDGWVYEIALEGRTADPTFLRQRRDLDAFRLVYQEALGLIAGQHGILASIDLIPAVPAPVAILLGRERLPKVHPALRVFDHDRTSGGYQHRLDVS